MSRRTLVLDGLWYSLCPSFTARSLNGPSLFLRTKQQSSGVFTPAVTHPAQSSSRRCYTSDHSGGHKIANPYPSSSSNVTTSSPTSNETVANPETLSEEDFKQYPSTTDMLDDRREKELQRLYKEAMQNPATPGLYESLPTSFLERKLQEDMARNPRIGDAERFFRVLIRDRKIKPTARHYKALILANCDYTFGSSVAVQRLLNEMDSNNIAMDSGTLHAALQALAVHPDYFLRQKVLNQLRDRWLPLSPAGWHFVVAGFMRENQFEKALEQLEAMERKNIQVERWLHSLIVYILCDHNEFEQVYRLVRRRVEQGHELTHQVWSHVLCKASEGRHHELTRYIWERRVNLGYLHPSEDTCSKTMYVAAKFGDPELGRAAFHYLRKSGYQPRSEDHDLGQRENLPAALEELCTMHEAGLEPRSSTMGLLYNYIIKGQIDPWEVWEKLKKLSNDRRSVPIGAVEVIVKAWKNESRHHPTSANDALQLYRELYTVCPGGATLALYNTLINICRRAGKINEGMYLLKEMISLGILPSSETFEFAIRMCLDAGSFKSAWMYLQDMEQRNLTLSYSTQSYIQEICLKSVDPDAIRLRYHPSAQLPPQPEPVEPVEPARPVWTREPKPSQATRRRRRRQRERLEALEAQKAG
ncbi:hypothetical protein N7450_000237 [Penicillium hetheringtonii]|uniref:Pentatricopeptide repeat-containing protein-mitochondrial domain-containing protein n=1 Tax=Penicillium hetheringtonii TaxID=911720 RepID=A0AAD6E303_9EURO|nr:hypothetical protein N7450_000237 [Penicillium hetheringtonii]